MKMTFEWRALLVVLLLTSAGCSLAGSGDDDDNVVEGVDLDLLFAPAASVEIEAVEVEWASRDVSARGVEVVREGEVATGGWSASVRIISHELGRTTHYGAVLVPTADADRKRPVLVYLHGGDSGVLIDDEVATLLSFVPEIRDSFIVVVPSFRSEAVVFEGDAFVSDGPPSPWDRDVDDAIALVNAAVETVPSADAERIVVLGFSRGAGVGLLMGARDERIDGVVEFFGPTDFISPFVREVTRKALRGELEDLPGIEYLNETFIQPLKEGDLAVEDVRLELVRRSAVYFVDRLPPVQIHHGLSDDVVPAAQGQALVDALEAAGISDFESYLYPGGEHNPLTLSGSVDSAVEFLVRVAFPVPA